MEQTQMRRKDRQVTASADIDRILASCSTVSIGFTGGEYPYVVPVSFGLERCESCGKLMIYFHCAGEGKKLELAKENDKVCVEAHNCFGTVTTPKGGATTSFESIIGFGRITEVTDEEEKIKGLRLICSHCKLPDYPVESCGSLKNTTVMKVILETVSGKSNKNLP